MDIIGNVLWALSSYNKNLMPFCELLNCKDFSAHEYEFKSILGSYLLDQYASWDFTPSEQEAEAAAEAVAQVQADDDKILMNRLVTYAQAMAHHTSYGDVPWRRVSRIIEQFTEEEALCREFDFWASLGPKL